MGKRNNLKKIMKKLPPGYPMSRILVNGAAEDVTQFVNEKEGLAYFDVAGQVGVYEAKKIHGMLFGAAADAGEEEEEEAGGC
ncbi:hypothetical protein [Mesobacillus foraminis]|uniref:hypothetical protein n=1 Tax=Mesobacillus foraminis TaxID=279826 RepID=UPI000EF4F58B|nr:hypothetical protein [Mesobacillus foraminis]